MTTTDTSRARRVSSNDWASAAPSPGSVPVPISSNRNKAGGVASSRNRDAARTWAENGHFLEAASSIRLAIAFDPHNETYKQEFGEVQAGIAEARVRDLLKKSMKWSDPSECREGLVLCEDALLYRPHDPELNGTAARLALGLKDLDAARDYAERALEHSPDVARYRRTFAEVLVATGHKGHAVRELERALELDSKDEESKKLLVRLRTRPRRAAHGGSVG